MGVSDIFQAVFASDVGEGDLHSSPLKNPETILIVVKTLFYWYLMSCQNSSLRLKTNVVFR